MNPAIVTYTYLISLIENTLLCLSSHLWFFLIINSPIRQFINWRWLNTNKLGNDNWRIKYQIDATYYFIVLLRGSTCFGHYNAHHQELATMLLITTLVVSFLVCCRELLMMGIVIPETCWAYKEYNKITSGIQLVFYSSVITVMRGPIDIRFTSYEMSAWGESSENSPLSLFISLGEGGSELDIKCVSIITRDFFGNLFVSLNKAAIKFSLLR